MFKKQFFICVMILSIAQSLHPFLSTETSCLFSIAPFNYERDARQVTELFRQDYSCLSTRTFDPAHVDWMLKTHSPEEYTPELEGAMSIDVMRHADQSIGFVTYYLENADVGVVLFLQVGQEFRAQGHGEALLRHAIAELFACGAQEIQVATRAANLPAQRLYHRIGFETFMALEDFVFFFLNANMYARGSVEHEHNYDISLDESDFLDTFTPDLKASTFERVLRYIGAPLLRFYFGCQSCITSIKSQMLVCYAALINAKRCK